MHGIHLIIGQSTSILSVTARSELASQAHGAPIYLSSPRLVSSQDMHRRRRARTPALTAQAAIAAELLGSTCRVTDERQIKS